MKNLAEKKIINWFQIRIHLLCFIRNAYKERFLPLVKFLNSLRNALVIFQKTKEHGTGFMNFIRNNQTVKIQRIHECHFFETLTEVLGRMLTCWDQHLTISKNSQDFYWKSNKNWLSYGIRRHPCLKLRNNYVFILKKWGTKVRNDYLNFQRYRLVKIFKRSI